MALAAELWGKVSLHIVQAEFHFYQNSLPISSDGLHYINRPAQHFEKIFTLKGRDFFRDLA